MDGLKIAVSETGPVPDHQCALKDAILVAAAAGISDTTQIVEMAEAFHQFLMKANADKVAATAAATPVSAAVPPAAPTAAPQIPDAAAASVQATAAAGQPAQIGDVVAPASQQDPAQQQ